MEPGLGEKPEPDIPREKAQDVAIVLDMDSAIVLAEQVGEVDGVGRVRRVGIPRPFEVSQASRLAVVTAVPRGRPEGLVHVVRG